MYVNVPNVVVSRQDRKIYAKPGVGQSADALLQRLLSGYCTQEKTF
jgi:hypothetical protein